MSFGELPIPKIQLNNYYPNNKKKRKPLSPSKRIIIWENTPHICHICNKRINKLSEAEFDHVRAFAKGGTTMKPSHKLCNRVKSDSRLSEIKKVLGIPVKKTKRKKISKKRKPKNYIEEMNERIKKMGI